METVEGLENAQDFRIGRGVKIPLAVAPYSDRALVAQHTELLRQQPAGGCVSNNISVHIVLSEQLKGLVVSPRTEFFNNEVTSAIACCSSTHLAVMAGF